MVTTLLAIAVGNWRARTRKWDAVLLYNHGDGGSRRHRSRRRRRWRRTRFRWHGSCSRSSCGRAD